MKRVMDHRALIKDRIKKLWQESDFTSALFESLVGYAIVAADFDGNILAFNEGARQIYGFSPGEVIGKMTIDAFFPPDFVSSGRLEEFMARLITDGASTFEGDNVKKDGTLFPTHILCALTKDKDGGVVGFIEIIEDLTERKAADAELEKYSAHLEELVDAQTREIKTSYANQGLINALLKLSIEDIALDKLAADALDMILSASWLNIEPQGALFLSERDEPMALKASVGLPPPLRSSLESAALYTVPFRPESRDGRD